MPVERRTTDASMTRRRFLAVTGSAAGVIALARPERMIARAHAVLPPPVTTNAPSAELIAGPATIDLGGRRVPTWAYNESVPGPLLRVRAGDALRVRVTNRLDEATSVHWHGIALANAMDGVPDVTQPPIARGTSFDYEFVAPDPGTYFFHPHVGLQLDHGLYAPLIVDDPTERTRYDDEWIVVLDDWTDGVGPRPATIYARLRRGMNMGSDGSTGSGMRTGMSMGKSSGSNRRHSRMKAMGMSETLGGMPGDVAYPVYLLNGRPPNDPETFRSEAGRRIRIRIINAGSDTAFRFAVGGHPLTVTHADGLPVLPFVTDAVLLGMGERVDVLVTCRGGVSPVVARAVGKRREARAVLRAGRGAIDRWNVPELRRRLATVDELRPAPSVRLPARAPDRTHRLVLTGNDMDYEWSINGKTYDPASAGYPVSAGERVRLELQNQSTMWHPMHLHGHTFAVATRGGPGVRKDTVIVKPGERVAIVFDATNPGAWMLHCHNTYHLEAGMMTAIRYT